MDYKISDHFTMKKMAAFTFMPILTIILCSVYTIVDGLFVSNFCRETAFAGMNISAAYTFLFASFGYMIGEGGCALLGKYFGENKNQEAKELFSLLIVFSIVLGVILSFIAFFTLDGFLHAQGAESELFLEARAYGRILIWGFPAYILQFAFQQFFVAADKPQMGVVFALIAGIVNIGFDALFIVCFEMGVRGAAFATVLGQITGVIVPFIYILVNKEFPLKIVGFKLRGQLKDLLKVCTNGSSEMLSNVAAQVVCILYNSVLVKLSGVDGVSAYSVLLYVTMIFSCVFMGYDMGVIPIVAYNFGAENKDELRNVRKQSQKLIFIYSAALIILANILAAPICSAFVGYNSKILQMSIAGIRIMSVGYLVTGYNLFGSAMFTGLNNGGISAFLSGVRTFVLPIICLYIFSWLFGMNGVWYSLPATEILAFIITFIVIKLKKNQYSY